MTEKKNFFRIVFNAMIEARSMQAERELAAFRNTENRSYREIF